MQETIRERIARRVRWTAAAAFIGWLLVASSAVAKLNTTVSVDVTLLGAALFLGAIVSLLFVRCPKCLARISQTIAMPVGLSFGRRRRVNYCPFCGVHLDDPCPESGNPIVH